MPSIEAATQADLSRYTPMAKPTVPAMEPIYETKGFLFQRCPLPTMLVPSDNIGQFNAQTIVPQSRLIPLPIPTSTQTIKETTTVTSTSSSSSSSTATVLKALSATLTISSISVGGIFSGSISLARSFQLLQLSSSVACDIRLYGSLQAQASDLTRATDTPVPAGEDSGYITNVVFDSLPFSWSWQNRIGANADSPQTTTVYVTVVNTTASVISPIINFLYLPLQTS